MNPDKLAPNKVNKFMERKSIVPDAKKIFVVDDNKVVLKAMFFSLTEKGYLVLMAENGTETISILRKDRPDLILLDLDFPPDTINLGGACGTAF